MAPSRKKRTKVFNQNIADEWGERWLDFIINFRGLEKVSFNDWQAITRNKNITMNVIENHPEYTWNIPSIICNPNLTQEFIENHPEIEMINGHRTIIGHIDKPELYLECDYSSCYVADNELPVLSYLCRNKKFTFEFALKYFPSEVANPNSSIWNHLSVVTPIKTIEKNKFLYWKWWRGVSQNKSLTTQYIEKCILEGVELDYNFISQSKALTIDLVIRFIDKPWNWDYISKNSAITMHDIEKNINLPWKWEKTLENPNITNEFITKFKRYKYCDYTDDEICRRIGKTISINEILIFADPYNVINNFDDISRLCNSPCCSCDLMLPHTMGTLFSEKTFAALSLNDNLRFRMVNEKDPWKFYGFMQNSFDVEKDAFIAENTREYMAAYKIQQAWNKAITNPYCRIGLNQIERDYKKFFTEDGRIRIC